MSVVQLMQAACIPVVRENGVLVQFGALWRMQHTVAIFIRHYWYNTFFVHRSCSIYYSNHITSRRCPMCQDYLRDRARHRVMWVKVIMSSSLLILVPRPHRPHPSSSPSPRPLLALSSPSSLLALVPRPHPSSSPSPRPLLALSSPSSLVPSSPSSPPRPRPLLALVPPRPRPSSSSSLALALRPRTLLALVRCPLSVVLVLSSSSPLALSSSSPRPLLVFSSSSPRLLLILSSQFLATRNRYIPRRSCYVHRASIVYPALFFTSQSVMSWTLARCHGRPEYNAYTNRFLPAHTQENLLPTSIS